MQSHMTAVHRALHRHSVASVQDTLLTRAVFELMCACLQRFAGLCCQVPLCRRAGQAWCHRLPVRDRARLERNLANCAGAQLVRRA